MGPVGNINQSMWWVNLAEQLLFRKREIRQYLPNPTDVMAIYGMITEGNANLQVSTSVKVLSKKSN